MKKIKVLYIVTRCTKSGPIKVINNIVDNIDRNKFEVYLISINEENPQRTIKSEMEKKYILSHVPISKTAALFGKYKPLIDAISKINPDVIHTTGAFPDFIISKCFPKKQLIIAHAYDVLDYKMQFGPIIGKILSDWHIRTMKRAGKVVACSKSLSTIYSQKENFKIDYIRNGLNCEKSNYENIRKSLGISDDIIMIYTASFNNRKNHKFLLESMIKIHESNKKIQLILLGDGPTFEKLKNKYSIYDYIHFVGRVKNVGDYLYSSDVFVSTSKQEGMPMAVLEAMQMGLPYVLSDIPQHEEIYEIDNSVGNLYREDDYRSFEIALNETLAIDRDEMKHRIKSIIDENFSSIKMSELYQKEYEKILEEKC